MHLLVLQADTSVLPSVWELTKSGGPLMWPIGLCSVVALAYAVERWIGLRDSRLGGARLARDVLAALQAGGPAQALLVCQRENTSLARILAEALRRAGDDATARERAVEDFAALEMKRLATNLKPLLLVYLVAPLLGLLGTVWGMIQAFATVALQKGLGRPELLASGVYQALVTTAAGLAIAIPTVVAYYYFKGRLEGFARQTEEFYTGLDEELTRAGAVHAH